MMLSRTGFLGQFCFKLPMKTPALHSPSPLRKALIVVLPIFAVATFSHAAPLLQENFDNLNAGALGGQNGWTALSDVVVTTGGLNYNAGSINIDGGTHRAQSNRLSPDVATPVATKAFASQSDEVWFSFTLLVDSSVNDSRFWFWVSDTTNLNTGLTASVTDNNTGNKNLFSEFRVNTTPTSTSSGGAIEDQVYFFVVRLSKDGSATATDAYDRLEMWVNPTSTTLSGSVIANGPAGNTITDGIANFGLTALSTAATLQWDNLLIGTTQADVLDVYAIPEPSTYAALGAFAVLGVAALRRRR